METPLLEMRHITKEFPGVKALDDVNLTVQRGEIHAICGENGAGKSTLMNVLSGVFPHGSYGGEIEFDGAPCRFKSVRDSEKLGIGFIHQHLTMIPQLSIAENIFLGNEQMGGRRISWEKTHSEALKIMKQVGLKANPEARVMDIGVGQQQLVEICKVLGRDIRLLILDEPTAALTEEESANLLNLLLDLKAQGLTSILISHKLHEITRVCDQITILRDGKTIETLSAEGEVSEDRIIRGMVGRQMDKRFPERESQVGARSYEVQNWNVFDPLMESRQIIHDVSFHVNSGEVLGIAGLMGAGRTELAMSLFGRCYGKRISGRVLKDGQPMANETVQQAIENGMALVTEDRQEYGLILDDSLKNNITLPSLKAFENKGVVNMDREIVAANEYRDRFHIKSHSVDQKVSTLSGGNQQKVVFSRWVLSGAQLLVLDEPTRGIDVGAKYEIYEVINELVAAGKSVVMISSDMVELLGMCDRVYVMNEGRFVGELTGEAITQEAIMQHIVEDNRRRAQG